MKILPSSSVDVRNLYGQQIQGVQTDATGVRAQQRAATERDLVELSADAKDIENAHEFSKTLPEVRAEKIAAIKEKVDTGSYNVDGRNVAAFMLQQAAGLPL